MKHLFFDIECCDGVHICEFGYVLTDGDFDVLQKECILIDPDWKFRLTGRRDGRDLHLSFEEDEYRRAEQFPAFYEKIREIVEASEQDIVGFSTKNDVRFLATACDRYQVPRFKIKTYFDIQFIYAALFGEHKRVSLEKAATAMGVPIDVTLHRSDEDALLTMKIAKVMCDAKNSDIATLAADAEKEWKMSRNHKEEVHCTIADLLKDKGFTDDFFGDD